jgi:hypothetical protein
MAQTPTGDSFTDNIQDLLDQPVDVARAKAILDQGMTYVRLLAPCKKSVWLTYEDLPHDVKVALIAAGARMLSAPNGVRQETIGEYSVTYGGSGSSDAGVFLPSEARVIASIAGCGGSFRTIPMTSPAVLDLARTMPADSVTDVDGVKATQWTWQDPNHDNGFVGKWVPR